LLGGEGCHFLIVVVVVVAVLAIEVILVSQRPRHAWQVGEGFSSIHHGAASSNYGDRTSMVISLVTSPATPSHIPGIIRAVTSILKGIVNVIVIVNVDAF
jgi:hypothetical protein